MLQKILIISKNDSKEDGAKLNQLQKIYRKHISVYSRSGGWELQKFDVILSVLFENELILHNFIISS